MSDSELKAKDYRRLFLELVGFPLIRANAVRFVADIGDLRRVENLKQVYEAAIKWKDGQPTDSKVLANEERDRLLSEIAIRDEKITHNLEVISDLRECITALQDEMQANTDALQKEIETLFAQLSSPEEHTGHQAELSAEDNLAAYLEAQPEPITECILAALFSASGETSKSTYRKLAKAFHSDSSRLPKHRAEALFRILRSMYEQLTDSQQSILPEVCHYESVDYEYEPTGRIKDWGEIDDPETFEKLKNLFRRHKE